MDDALAQIARLKHELENGGTERIRTYLKSGLSTKDTTTLVAAITRIGGVK